MSELSREQLLLEIVEPFALISCLSFEERSLSVASAIATKGLRRWLVIVNDDIETDVSSVREQALALAGDVGIQIEFLASSKINPLLLADALVALSEGVASDPGMHWVADITTMTHEMLLVLIAAADEVVTPWRDLKLIYNVAGAYSGDDSPEDKWISRGIHQVRSVVGYPGSWSPGEQTQLIALPGFDSERMRRMVEEIEPEVLTVGIACPLDGRHAWSEEKNRKIAEKLLDTRKGRTFDYRALDPFGVIDAVTDILQDVSGNVLIAPLNSKVSTAAIGALARLRPEWQICYAPAVIYNLKYATPSDRFLVCSLRAMIEYASARLTAQRVKD